MYILLYLMVGYTSTSFVSGQSTSPALEVVCLGTVGGRGYVYTVYICHLRLPGYSLFYSSPLEIPPIAPSNL